MSDTAGGALGALLPECFLSLQTTVNVSTIAERSESVDTHHRFVRQICYAERSLSLIFGLEAKTTHPLSGTVWESGKM